VKSVEQNPLAKIPPAFFADAMLGSIARKLRIFGFDTIYIRDIKDEEVLGIASKLDRVILTCDKELFKRVVKVGGYGILLSGIDDVDNLAYIFAKYTIKPIDLDTITSRCALCNGQLKNTKIEDLESVCIPPKVRLLHREIFRCVSCNKNYWKGNHFKQLRNMAKLVGIRLDSSSRKGYIQASKKG
jgi:uncharacterized protein with PIN domain